MGSERAPVPPPKARTYMEQQREANKPPVAVAPNLPSQQSTTQIPQIPSDDMNAKANATEDNATATASTYRQMPSYPVENLSVSTPPPANYGNYDNSVPNANNDVSSFEQKILSRDKPKAQLQSFRIESEQARLGAKFNVAAAATSSLPAVGTNDNNKSAIVDGGRIKDTNRIKPRALKPEVKKQAKNNPVKPETVQI